MATVPAAPIGSVLYDACLARIKAALPEKHPGEESAGVGTADQPSPVGLGAMGSFFVGGTIRRRSDAYFGGLRAAGGDVTTLDLPKIGVHSNSHLLMLQRNNLDIAARIQDWLIGRNLMQRPPA